MVERKRLLALDYYKKEHFSGSDADRNMRYRIERIVPEADGAGDDGAVTDGAKDGSAGSSPAEPLFRVTVWPEPYSYEKTDPSLFLTHTAPFSEDGLCSLVDWMNEQRF